MITYIILLLYSVTLTSINIQYLVFVYYPSLVSIPFHAIPMIIFNILQLLVAWTKVWKTFSKNVGMAVPKTTETRCMDGSVQARQVAKRLHKQPHPYISFCTWSSSASLAMRLLQASMCSYNLSCLYTTILTPSFCGIWHCHPYIPLHFWKMFFILGYIPFFLHNSTPKEDVVLTSFFWNWTNTQMIRAAIATTQWQRLSTGPWTPSSVTKLVGWTPLKSLELE